MRIIINKIVRDHEKDPATGKLIIDPTTKKKIEKGWKQVTEGIELESVKTFRPWHRSKNVKDQYTGYIDGDVTVLYMKGGKIDRKPPEIHVAENFKSWTKRCGAIDVEG